MRNQCGTGPMRANEGRPLHFYILNKKILFHIVIIHKRHLFKPQRRAADRRAFPVEDFKDRSSGPVCRSHDRQRTVVPGRIQSGALCAPEYNRHRIKDERALHERNSRTIMVPSHARANVRLYVRP